MKNNDWTPERLFLLRFHLGKLSQAEAAELLGVHRVTWNRWEGGRPITRKYQEKITRLALSRLQKGDAGK